MMKNKPKNNNNNKIRGWYSPTEKQWKKNDSFTGRRYKTRNTLMGRLKKIVENRDLLVLGLVHNLPEKSLETIYIWFIIGHY